MCLVWVVNLQKRPPTKKFKYFLKQIYVEFDSPANVYSEATHWGLDT